MGRSPCCQNMRLKKGPWTPEEDEKLTAYVQEHGHGNWRWLPAKAGLQRCGKSCRLRWINYLKPDIKRGKFSMEEDRTIVQLHAFLGNRWSIIAAHLPKRTDNEIKNYWNTHLKKRLIKMGIDPITHKPKTEALGESRDAAYLRHMAQWESARLEAEARLGSSSSSSRLPDRLMVSKVPPQPSLPPCLDILKAWQSLWGLPSEDDNNRSLYYMYAIMLANDDGLLESPASVSNAKLPTNTIETSSSGGPKQNPNVELREKRVEEDRYDDIMVAVEAFRAARHQNIMEGPNDDMSAFDSYEKLAEEIEDENDMKYYWNSLVNWDI